MYRLGEFLGFELFCIFFCFQKGELENTKCIFKTNALGICTKFWLHGVSCYQNWHGRAAVARNKENSKKSSTKLCATMHILHESSFRVFFARTICRRCTKHVCTLHIVHGRAAKSPYKHPAMRFSILFLQFCVAFNKSENLFNITTNVNCIKCQM